MQTIPGWNGGVIKAFTDGVEFEFEAQKQVHNTAGLPFIHDHIAIMPDVHFGIGATVGSVIPTKGAIIPAAVGVDIGCGMCAVQTSLKASDLPDNLSSLRSDIEATIPVGFNSYQIVPASVAARWIRLEQRFAAIIEKHPGILKKPVQVIHQLGTLGGGNHFIEMCLDTDQNVWLMLHSGSRGIGNKIGTYFIERAKEALAKSGYGVPDKNLAWLDEGTDAFADYVEAMLWAQDYAAENRNAMLARILNVLHAELPMFTLANHAINCHHNFAQKEYHFGADVWVTRKGAVQADAGKLGIIPGSMGAKSFIVRGKGNADSFNSCSHGAGRRMSRGKAKEAFTMADLVEQTAGVECRKDSAVIDEIPMAYKSIDAVMAAQIDLVEVVAQLKQVLCVKG